MLKLWILVLYIVCLGMMIWCGCNFVLVVIFVYVMWIKWTILVKSLLKMLKWIMFGDWWLCEINFKMVYFTESLKNVYSFHVICISCLCGGLCLCGNIFPHWYMCIMCGFSVWQFIFGLFRFKSMYIFIKEWFLWIVFFLGFYVSYDLFNNTMFYLI